VTRACLVILDDTPHPALLLDVGDRLCRVRLASGDEFRVGAARLPCIDEGAVDEAAFPDVARGIVSQAQQLDLRELWALLVDDVDEIGRAEACELLTGRTHGPARLAFELRLLGETVFFDARADVLKPRKRKAVEQEIVRRDRLAAQERELGEAVAWTNERLASPDGSAPILPPFFEQVRAAALTEDEATIGKDVRRLLDRAGFGAGSRWSGPRRAAFELLRALGVFAEDEDLNLLRHDVVRGFPDWMVQLARDLHHAPSDRPTSGDSLVAYTIDDATTRDYDDALALEPDGDGWRLHVLIADPTSVLDPGNPLWKEARRRGSTVYHPEGKAPMLPPALSEGHLSLVAGEERPALDFALHLHADGTPRGVTIERKRVRVRENLTYDEVDRLLTATGDDPRGALMRRLNELALKLQAQRIARGALLLRRPEVSARVLRDGSIELSRIDPGSPARELVAEMMIACGGQAATWLRDRGLAAVYRRQARVTDPSAAVPTGIVEGIVPWYQAVRLIRKAELSLHPEPHEGLGLPQYVQVTSPLRRFQDLLLHEQIRAFLATGQPRFSDAEMLRSFAEIEELHARNQRIQNDARRYWTLKHLLVKNIAEVRGTVVWRDRQGFKVYLDDFGLEGLVRPRADLDIGAEITLRVEACDPREGTLRLAE
jgi:exoribonuclease-2